MILQRSMSTKASHGMVALSQSILRVLDLSRAQTMMHRHVGPMRDSAQWSMSRMREDRLCSNSGVERLEVQMPSGQTDESLTEQQILLTSAGARTPGLRHTTSYDKNDPAREQQTTSSSCNQNSPGLVGRRLVGRL